MPNQIFIIPTDKILVKEETDILNSEKPIETVFKFLYELISMIIYKCL